MVKAAEIVKEKELSIMDAEVFLRTDGEGPSRRNTHVIRFDKDSYIWCFTGRRGGGKTTAMTFVVVRAVALYNLKVIANYPIEFMMRRHRPDGKTYLQHVKSEPLDFEKLLCFDEDYKHVLICIDEAPDIISHMASLTWRNRLVAAFTRQLRKNYNTLLLGAQDFNLIDKSMRWQVDLITECQDAARVAGEGAGVERGEVIWMKLFDHSGQFTGKSTEDRLRCGKTPYVKKIQLYPRLMWGDDEHKPVFDSWHQIDILDSLRKVDLRMSSIQIGDKANQDASDRYPVSLKVLKSALSQIEMLRTESPDNPATFQKHYYTDLGGLTEQDKNNLGRKLSQFGVERGGEGSKRWFSFASFDIQGFREYIDKQAAGDKENNA